jgi:FtsZ-interacting cell division protein YlmF
MNYILPLFRRGPKDFEIMNEERDEEGEEEEEEDEEEGGEERTQTEEPAITESKESCWQKKTSDKIVNQATRVFTIPRPPVLRRS